MKKPHLIWILIDSARNYQTDEDDRGLPQSVVDFSKESIFFQNVITSAPSTIQSISSMMTSSPSYLLSRSYNNFRGQLDCFDYFPQMLRKEGYDVFGAIYFKHGREVMSDMFGMIDKKYYPKNLSHRKVVWNNMDVYNIFSNIVEKHTWDKPTMCYLHYNVRVDLNISEIIQNTLNKIKDAGLMENSVVMINSDHGYPASSRNYDFETGLKEGWGHDKYLTNDNILTPWVLHYPGVKPHQIEEYVATTDIVPTLCKLLDIQPSSKFHGTNVLNPRIDLSSRLNRTDNRYVGQLPSFVSYIQGQKKAIIERNSENKEIVEYFDLSTDPLENNVLKLSDGFEEFKQAVDVNIAEMNNFHQQFLTSKWAKIASKLSPKQGTKAGIVIKSTPAFTQIAKSALELAFPNIDFEIINDNGNSYELLFVILESEIPWHFAPYKKLIAKSSTKQIIYLDNNGVMLSKFIQSQLYLNFIKKRFALIKHDPLFILELVKRMIQKKLLPPIQ